MTVKMTVGRIICLVVILLLAVVGGFLIAKKSKKHNNLKWVGLFILLAFALTWIFELSNGFYYSTEFSGLGLNPLGISDISNIIYNSIYLASDKIIFLLVLGIFYGVLSKSKGYKKMVSTLAEKFEGKEILFALLSSLLIVVMTTLFTDTYAVLIFVPFIISIALSMKLDKLSAFAISFGSILVGLLGVTYGSDGLHWINYYFSTGVTEGILYRFLILIVSFILFSFFNILHIKKVLKNKNVNETEDDPFKVEKVDKKSNLVLPIIGLILLLVIVVLGFVNWEEFFGISVFTKFHSWLLDLQIGEFPIVKYILGNYVVPSTQYNYGPFGYWNLHVISAIMLVMTVVVALFGRIKFNDYIEGCLDGLKKISKPLIYVILVFIVMVIAYMCLFVPTIVYLISKASTTFNPFITALSAFISSAFYSYLDLTAYAVAPYFTGNFPDSLNIIHLIFVTMYGFVQLILPTSAILMLGLSYLKIDYKSWFKYIWIFALGILIILLVLYTVISYV